MTATKNRPGNWVTNEKKNSKMNKKMKKNKIKKERERWAYRPRGKLFLGLEANFLGLIFLHT